MFALAYGAPACAAEAKAELEFQPSSVTLAVGIGQQATALVVLHNPTNSALRDVRLSWLPRPDLDVEPPSPLTLPALAPHADYVWTLNIKPSHSLPTPGALKPAATAGKPGPTPGMTASFSPPGPPETRIDESLDFLLQYKTPVSGREVTQVVLKSLPVKTQDLGDLDKALDVQIKTALETLESSETGSIYVILKNNSARTISVTGVTPIAKGNPFCLNGKTRPAPSGGQADQDSLPFCFTSTFPAVTLSPYQTIIEELLVRAHQRVRAGKYLLVLQIATQSYEGGVPLRRNVVVSQAIDVAVLGESAILKVAGIPAFFLLPGTLLLLTISVCWSLEKRWWRAPDGDEFPLKYTDPNFWLVSVTISLAIAFFLLMAEHRWYFASYGLPDIGMIWFASILAGILCYLIWWTYRDERRKRAEAEQQQKEKDEAARTFSEKDQPVDVISKLRLRHQGLLRDRVKLKDKEGLAFVLAGSQGDNSIWACPPADLDFGGADEDLQEKIGAQITDKGDLATLEELLKKDSIIVSWKQQPIDRVRSVAKEEIESWETRFIFLR